MVANTLLDTSLGSTRHKRKIAQGTPEPCLTSMSSRAALRASTADLLGFVCGFTSLAVEFPRAGKVLRKDSFATPTFRELVIVCTPSIGIFNRFFLDHHASTKQSRLNAILGRSKSSVPKDSTDPLDESRTTRKPLIVVSRTLARRIRKSWARFLAVG